MGVEQLYAVTTNESHRSNFTNEGGYNYRFRYLKNIMGLWMIQSARRELGSSLSFDELIGMAQDSKFQGLVDVNSPVFLAPKSMLETVRNESRAESAGDIIRCIYQSLALSYMQTLRELETLTGKRYKQINIIGGGSKDTYLNKLTALATGLPVYAGPVEGTSLGNLVSQMIKSGDLADVDDARNVIRNSFEIKEVLP